MPNRDLHVEWDLHGSVWNTVRWEPQSQLEQESNQDLQLLTQKLTRTARFSFHPVVELRTSWIS